MKINKGLRTYLLMIIILTAALFVMALNYFTSENGNYVEISVNGNVVNKLPLSKNATFKINGYDGGQNTIIIQDGFCYVNEADCPDKLCIKQGKISKSGESIICLPHRVVATVINENENKVDTISK